MFALERHREEYTEKLAVAAREEAEDRADAVRNRESASRRPKIMQALNGTLELFRGAYVHAYRPDWGMHEYGVVIAMTPKTITLSNEESDWTSRIWPAKHEVEILDERQWAIVEREQKRRRAEYEAAEKSGRQRDLVDYARVEITLADHKSFSSAGEGATAPPAV